MLLDFLCRNHNFNRIKSLIKWRKTWKRCVIHEKQNVNCYPVWGKDKNKFMIKQHFSKSGPDKYIRRDAMLSLCFYALIGNTFFELH